MTEKKSKKLSISISFLLLAIITFISFSPCINNGFVNYDDGKYVKNNDIIKRLSSQNIKKMFTNIIISKHHYHPVTLFSWAVEYKFFKLNPKIYHINNVVLHILNIYLVFLLIYILTRSISKSYLVALLFAIHPMHVESVAWITERKDVLYSFFYFASLISYCLYCSKTSNNPKFIYISLILFLLSLLSKPAAVTLPLLLFAFDYYYKRGFNAKLLLEKVPFILFSFIFALIALNQKSSASEGASALFSIFDRLFFANYCYLAYMLKMFVPVNLSCFYPYPQKVNNFLPVIFYISPILNIILFFIVFKIFKNFRNIIFGFLFYTLTIFPVLGIFSMGSALMGDRYTYVPYIGLFFIISEFFMSILNKIKNYSKLKNFLTKFIIFVIMISLSVLTYKQCKIWEDSIKLWSNVVDIYPGAAIAYKNRGDAYEQEGRYNLAVKDYSKTIEINPRLPGIHNNRAILYLNQGKYDLAEQDFSKAIVINPNEENAYSNRAVLYIRQNKNKEAMLDLNKALSLNPEDKEAYNNRGMVYFINKNFEDAMSDFNKALEIDPDFYLAYVNLGNIYFDTGRKDLALNNYNKALIINKDYARGYFLRSILLVSKKEFSKALKDAEKANSLGYKVKKEYINYLKSNAHKK